MKMEVCSKYFFGLDATKGVFYIIFLPTSALLLRMVMVGLCHHGVDGIQIMVPLQVLLVQFSQEMLWKYLVLTARLAFMSKHVQVVYGENEIGYQIGETTEILSGGQLCATPHCVRAPKGELASGVERSTFALFMQPNWDEKLIFPELVNIHEFIMPKESISFGDFTEKVLDKYYDVNA